MPTPEQKKKLLKAKIAVALHDELGRAKKGRNRAGVSSFPRHVQSNSRTALQTAGTEEIRATGNLLTPMAMARKNNITSLTK